MAEEKKYTENTAAVLKADSLKRIYDVLESEETPFEARVQKAAKGERLVTISTEPQHIQHFTNVLNKCKGV
ncbi:hypothetical protein [Prevotella sp. OH937_COT-195]|uniref:hypothetical protein n=1 Tax=Prevotella sp. OH937_COT-195 TaxID=2491051 RepID=UPI000F64A706|nr:hypothetical protein [Prevotella sp. OH937_COT-195]RRC99073.1 hypothetical protein EII32_08555 [Prevotella sp. OH937_COT-195]